MLLPGDNPKTWLLLTVFVSTIIAYCECSGAKTLDINIGFDLTQRNNEGSSLRIEDRKDPGEFNRRAVDDSSSSDSRSHRKNKHSDESAPKKSESSKENKSPHKSSGGESASEHRNSDSSSTEDRRSTRGIKAADQEPDEDYNPKVHGKYHSSDRSDRDRSNRS